jgi:hypothetical protein
MLDQQLEYILAIKMLFEGAIGDKAIAIGWGILLFCGLN